MDKIHPLSKLTVYIRLSIIKNRKYLKMIFELPGGAPRIPHAKTSAPLKTATPQNSSTITSLRCGTMAV